jgi:transcriptional regulator with XRE-family HTH domain
MITDIDALLGRRLRTRRRMLNLTQQGLGERCGVTFQQIQKYESGANRLSASRLWALSEALGVPVSYFFEGAPRRTPLASGEALQ